MKKLIFITVASLLSINLWAANKSWESAWKAQNHSHKNALTTIYGGEDVNHSMSAKNLPLTLMNDDAAQIA